MTLAVLGVTNTNRGEEIRNGYINPTILRARMWAKWLHNPCRLEGPQGQVEKEIRSGYSTLAVSGPICGHSGYITCAVSGIPIRAGLKPN